MNTLRAALVVIFTVALVAPVAEAQRGRRDRGGRGGTAQAAQGAQAAQDAQDTQDTQDAPDGDEAGEGGPAPSGAGAEGEAEEAGEGAADSRQWWERGSEAPEGTDASEAGGAAERSGEAQAGEGDASADAQESGESGDSQDSGNGEPDPEVAEEGWQIKPYGFIRAGYEYVQNDARYDFVGENDGFILANARAGLMGGSERWNFSFRLSAEGAADIQGVVNSPEADLEVRMRDVFIQWDFLSWMGVRLGQFKVPFMAGWLGRDGALPFASRAVGLQGVPVGRGFELDGIVYDRELGLRVGSSEPVFFGDLGLAYYLTAFNGNGPNQLLDDNGRLALAGRFEAYFLDWVRIGGGVLWNSRTEGPLPDRFDEEDLGFTADATVQAYGIEFVGHFTLVNTTYETVANPTRQRMEFHLQGGYLLPFIPIPLVVNYRFAYYDPWQNGGAGGGVDLSTFELLYHTVGLRIHHPAEVLGLTAWLNYTFTIENAARQVDNDRLEVIVQLTF